MASIQEEFLKTTICPGTANVVPPNVNNLATFSKDQTVFGTITNLPNAAILWLPQRSPSSVIVLIKPTSSLSPTVTIQGSVYTLTFSGNYYWPTNSIGIDVAPDLAEDFSAYRQYAGVVHIVSDTTSTTNAALSGEMHAAAIYDLRGLRQLRVTDIVQQTITKKDAVWNVKVSDGVVSVLGADIQTGYSAPSASLLRDDSLSGVDYLMMPTFVNVPVASQSVFVFSAPGVNITTPQPPGWSINYFSLPDFSWTDCIDYQVLVAGATTADYVTATHYYVTINATTGAPAIQTSQHIAPVFGPNGLGPSSSQTIEFRTPIDQMRVDQGTQALWYVGTSITVDVVCDVRIIPIARSIYRQGRLGPARIMMWSNVAPNQNVKVTGIFRNQLIATGAVAPYATTQNEVGSINASLIPYVASLYNGPSEIYKRVFSGSEYREICKNCSGNHTVARAAIKANPSVASEASASGLFSALGSLAGSVFGLPKLGGAIGHVADTLTGNASGMFGSASGMFGSASGTYEGDCDDDTDPIKSKRRRLE